MRPVASAAAAGVPALGEKILSGTPPYVLVAEDDPATQFRLRKVLERAGYEVLVVENGRQAVDACRARRPDLVLLDDMMPVLDGHGAAARLIRDEALDGVPILALTGGFTTGDQGKSFDTVCDDWIPKPVSARILLEGIRAWLARKPSTWMPQRMARRTPPERAA
jgi:DNA-binding response OmpR family regulator